MGQTQASPDRDSAPDRLITLRVGVVLAPHNPQVDPPSHFVSRPFAAFLCSRPLDNFARRVSPSPAPPPQPLAVRISKRLIHLTTAEGIAQLKVRFRPPAALPMGRRPIPRLLPPSPPINLDLDYPERWRVTVHHPHEAFLPENSHALAADLMSTPDPDEEASAASSEVEQAAV